jgi:hypothetical protein
MTVATRFTLLPEAATPMSSNFPQLQKINTANTPRFVLSFDAATAETAVWSFNAPQGLSGTWVAVVTFCMASATSGKVDFTVAVEAITSGDSLNTLTTDSFDTENAITAPTVPGTAGYPLQFSCTLTNMDSIAAGDLVRLKLKRDATDGTNDTATGDCHVLSVELRDGN